MRYQEHYSLNMKWWPREDVSTCESFVDLISKGKLDASLQPVVQKIVRLVFALLYYIFQPTLQGLYEGLALVYCPGNICVLQY